MTTKSIAIQYQQNSKSISGPTILGKAKYKKNKVIRMSILLEISFDFNGFPPSEHITKNRKLILHEFFARISTTAS